ncbi:MAG: alpha/beta hydrolase [Eubacteriales bacterium]|nr:alpha/beta hydrolase [Eubacteriales bacterium]
MKKKLVAAMVALAMVSSSFAAFAEEGTAAEIIMQEGDPDFSEMTVEEWETYEFNKDYAEVFSDVTSYSHEDLRKLLDSHWNMYTLTGIPDIRTLSDEESRELIAAHHNLRAGIEPLNDVEEKRIYLWPDGEVPAVTEYTENTDYAYADWPDFQPYMLEQLVEDGTEVKGAVVLAAGGGHMFRSNVEETYEVALAFNALGYQCFIVNYRVNPYTHEEAALDVARAVRIVRGNAESYGIEEDRIACAGFSNGGSVLTVLLDNYTGDVNASALVEGYEPDEVDAVSADVNAYLSIYGNYNTEAIDTDKFPPVFFAIGGEDGWESVSQCFDYVRDAGIQTELHVFAGVPHGFGAGVDAGGNEYANALTWTQLADCFMQDVYTKADAPAEETEAEPEETETGNEE